MHKVNYNEFGFIRPPYPNVYNGVVTVPVKVVAGTRNNSSTPYYFTDAPVLRNKHITGIVLYPVLATQFIIHRSYLTFKNGSGENIVSNLPAHSIYSNFVTNGSNKFPGFDLYDIDINASFYEYINNVSWVITGTLFNLNFYY